MGVFGYGGIADRAIKSIFGTGDCKPPPQWDDGWTDTGDRKWASEWIPYVEPKRWWRRVLHNLAWDIRELVCRTDSIRRKINAQSPVIEHAVGDIDWLKKQVSKLLADNESIRSVALHRWRDAVRAELRELGCLDSQAAMDLPITTYPGSDDEEIVPAVNRACYDEVYDAVGQYQDGCDPFDRALFVRNCVPALFETFAKKGGKR